MYFLFPSPLIEREEEGEKEVEKRCCGRETSISCLLYVLQPGTKPTTQAHALTGNRTGDLLLCRMMPNLLSHMSQGKEFKIQKII